MDLELAFTGDIVERQELLNGAETATLEGATADGAWTLSAVVTWNIGLEANTGEGDITLARVDGAEIYGTLASGDVAEAAEADDASHNVRLEYDVDGGAGDFALAAGRITAEGTLTGDTFSLRLSLSLP